MPTDLSFFERRPGVDFSSNFASRIVLAIEMEPLQSFKHLHGSDSASESFNALLIVIVRVLSLWMLLTFHSFPADQTSSTRRVLHAPNALQYLLLLTESATPVSDEYNRTILKNRASLSVLLVVQLLAPVRSIGFDSRRLRNALLRLDCSQTGI